MEDPGWDAVKKYFRKIMNSFALGLLWMLAVATAAFYFKFAFVNGSLRWPNIVFYGFALVSLAALVWYYYKIWKE